MDEGEFFLDEYVSAYYRVKKTLFELKIYNEILTTVMIDLNVLFKNLWLLEKF